VIAPTIGAVGFAFTVKLLLDVQPVAVSVKVKVTVPALMPDTTPVFVTVATAVLLLIHVPPVVGVTVAELPTHTSFAPPKTGLALTVKLLLAEQPVAVSVKVKVTVPAVKPATTPVFVTVAIALSLLVHMPPVFGVTLAELPAHVVFAPPKTGLAGIPLMTTFVLCPDIHVFAFSTENVYGPPGGKPLIVAVVVFPIVVTPPGVLVTFQVPVGNPLNTTLPVGMVHVGCVMVPTIGAEGGNGSLKHA
jgi:hypothetical protein